MSDLNKKFVLHSLTYGGIVSAVLIMLSLIMYVFSVDIFNWVISLLYQLVTIVFITWMMALAAIKFKNKYLDNRIRFWQCLLMAVIIGFTSAILVTLYNYLFNAFFDPDYMRENAEKVMEMIDSNPNIPDDRKQQALADIEKRFDPVNSLKTSLISMSILSVVLGLISTLFVRKKEKVPENVV